MLAKNFSFQGLVGSEVLNPITAIRDDWPLLCGFSETAAYSAINNWERRPMAKNCHKTFVLNFKI